jgi:hypothetical protein
VRDTHDPRGRERVQDRQQENAGRDVFNRQDESNEAITVRS